MRDRFPRPGLFVFRCRSPCGFRSPCGWVSRVRSRLCLCGPHARPIPASPCRVFAFFFAVVPRLPLRLGAAGSSSLAPSWAQCSTDSRVSLPCARSCRLIDPCVGFKLFAPLAARSFWLLRGCAWGAPEVRRRLAVVPGCAAGRPLARSPRYRAFWPPRNFSPRKV